MLPMDEPSEIHVTKLETKIRPASLQRGIGALGERNEQEPSHIRAMIKRHQESQNQHVDRIRGNLPPSA
jgi:hypothetical protein